MITLSIVIPTLNAQLQLKQCLASIRSQSYPQNKIEIIVADGGSTDNTLKIAKFYKCRIVKNKLKTAEAGKAAGLTFSRGLYVAFIDSDNILPDPNWLKSMLAPFKNTSIVISEPWAFTYRRHAGFIERYSSLIGSNDPYSYICGSYDRFSLLSGNWTGLPLNQHNYKSFIQVNLTSSTSLPTIGANGTIFRSSFLRLLNIDKYLFDIDLISSYLNSHSNITIAKVKTGIIHTYCESSIQKFIRKQTRRMTDYYIYRNLRLFNWQKSNTSCIPKFIIYTLSIVLPILDSFKGFFKKPDPAWFFHPIACLLSLWIYGLVTIKSWLGLLTPLKRNLWHQ